MQSLNIQEFSFSKKEKPIQSLLDGIVDTKNIDFFLLSKMKLEMDTNSYIRKLRRSISEKFPTSQIVLETNHNDYFLSIVSVLSLNSKMLYNFKHDVWFVALDSNATLTLREKDMHQFFTEEDLETSVNFLLEKFYFCGRLWRDGDNSILQVFL